MKRKYFFVILFLTFAIFLVGCGGTGIPTTPETSITDEAKVKSVIQYYWLALSNRQYELAKSYCIPFGDFYSLAEEYQNMPYFGSTTVVFTSYINWVKITGNNATVNTNITISVTVCFGDICAEESETLHNYSMDLIKSNGTWKLI